MVVKLIRKRPHAPFHFQEQTQLTDESTHGRWEGGRKVNFEITNTIKDWGSLRGNEGNT